MNAGARLSCVCLSLTQSVTLIPCKGGLMAFEPVNFLELFNSLTFEQMWAALSLVG